MRVLVTLLSLMIGKTGVCHTDRLHQPVQHTICLLLQQSVERIARVRQVKLPPFAVRPKAIPSAELPVNATTQKVLLADNIRYLIPAKQYQEYFGVEFTMISIDSFDLGGMVCRLLSHS